MLTNWQLRDPIITLLLLVECLIDYIQSFTLENIYRLNSITYIPHLLQSHINMAQPGPLNLSHLLTKFSDHWSQRTIGTLNDYEIKLAKLRGEFVWHSHPDTDEMFLVLSGTLNIQLRDRDVILHPGEVFVVPRGVEHCPKADEEVGVMVLEPKGVVNTGDSERVDLTKDVQPI